MKKKVSIEGMTCDHCKMHVEKALKEIPGVVSAQVSLKGKFAEVELSRDVEDQKIKDAVSDAGYEVTGIQ